MRTPLLVCLAAVLFSCAARGQVARDRAERGQDRRELKQDAREHRDDRRDRTCGSADQGRWEPRSLGSGRR